MHPGHCRLAAQAVGIAITASALGGLIGGIALMFVSPVLAKIALKFGPPEYFCLTLTGLIAIAVVATESTIKSFRFSIRFLRFILLDFGTVHK